MSTAVKRFGDLIHCASLRKPGATAIVAGDQRLNFEQLDDRAARLGSAFRKLGLKTEDRVALLAENELQNVEIQEACLRSGFVLVPLNTRLADAELEYILKDCSPAMLIGGARYAELVKRIGDRCGISRLYSTDPRGLVDHYDSLLELAAPSPDDDPVDSDLAALILYTSGTTGRPKGATISRNAFFFRVIGNTVEMQIRPDDVFLQNLPMFHISAFLCHAYLLRGATVVMLPSFDPQTALDLMQKEGVTAMSGVPTIMTMLLECPGVATFDPSLLRLFIYGGAPIDAPLLRRAIETFRCGFQQHYGMTESGSVSILRAEDHDPDDELALTSAGCDAPGYELRIVDENQVPVPDGERGEIILRGAGLMSYYWGLPDKTAETLVNGWMHTGDIGYRDERGFLHVVDRRNDMIISGGENVYPREIEAVLAEHPAMPEGAVIGLPDPKWGELVCCVIKEDAPPEAELDAWLRERLAGYKLPRRWFRVPELPRNVTGKVLKVELRKQFTGKN